MISGMPDNDYVPRLVRGAWRPVYRALRDGQEPQLVGRLLERASAAYLREHSCPGVDGLARDLRDCARANDGARFDETVARFYDQAGRTPLARVYADQAEVMFAVQRLEVAAMTDSDTLGALGRAALERVADSQMFDRALSDLTSTEVDFTAQQRYRDRCQQSADYECLVARQVAHPEGTGIRAPAHRRRLTSDMLDEEVS
jgi:hypothetical protein